MLESRCRFRGVEEAFGESLLILKGEPDDLRLLNTTLRRLLHSVNDEIGHGTPFEFRRPFEKGLQIRRDASFEARGLGHEFEHL